MAVIINDLKSKSSMIYSPVEATKGHKMDDIVEMDYRQQTRGNERRRRGRGNTAILQKFEERQAQLEKNQELMQEGLQLVYNKLESMPGYLRRNSSFNWYATEDNSSTSPKYNWFRYSDIVRIEFYRKTEKSIIKICSLDFPMVGKSNCGYDFAVGWYNKFLKLSRIWNTDIEQELREQLLEIVR